MLFYIFSLKLERQIHLRRQQEGRRRVRGHLHVRAAAAHVQDLPALRLGRRRRQNFRSGPALHRPDLLEHIRQCHLPGEMS